MPETVMIVAGETSGELYGALLASSLKRMSPGVKIIGIGGERMREAGVRLIAGVAGAFGIAEAVSAIRSLRKTFHAALDAFNAERPSVLVLIDYPDFNLKLAEKAKQQNIRVLYYVSPQVWAWRKNRIYKIARLVDRMAVILPFEVDIYRETGLACEFVGHPVLDEIEGIGTDRAELKKALGLLPGSPLLSLLPGSRAHEIEKLLPVMTEVLGTVRSEFREFQFCMPFAPNTDLDRYGPQIEALRKRGVVVSRGNSLQVLAASDLAVVASGTATLQAGLLGLPIVVIYKVSPLTYLIGKMLIRGKYITLSNILSGREVVKEFLQDRASASNVVAELRRIITDDAYRTQMVGACREVRALFSGRHASDRVAEMVFELAGWKRQTSS
ncbi:MAG: lipid-A-disaccharide synthase [Nitrospiraceae bacterium]|nr:lipid-A-disaccharide synthase [Nitrospiraceae bacterium]